MNNLQVFNFRNKEVRVINLNNQPYWVLKDVCKVLGISNSKMTAKRLEEDPETIVFLRSATQTR